MPHGTLPGYTLRGLPGEEPPRRAGKRLLAYQLSSSARKHSAAQRLPGIKKKFAELARLAGVEGVLLAYEPDNDAYHMVTTADTFEDTVHMIQLLLRQIELLLRVQDAATGGRMADTVCQEEEANGLDNDNDNADGLQATTLPDGTAIKAEGAVRAMVQQDERRREAVARMWALRGRLQLVHPCQYEDELFRTQQSGKQRDAAARGGAGRGAVSGLPATMAGREMWLPTTETSEAVRKLSPELLARYEPAPTRRPKGKAKQLSTYARQILAKDPYSQQYCRPSPFAFPLFSRVVGLRSRPAGSVRLVSTPRAFQEPSVRTLELEHAQRAWVENENSNKARRADAPPPPPAREEYEQDETLGAERVLVRRPVLDPQTRKPLYDDKGYPRTEVLVGSLPHAVRARSYRRWHRSLDELLAASSAAPKRTASSAQPQRPGADSASASASDSDSDSDDGPPSGRRAKQARLAATPKAPESDGPPGAPEPGGLPAPLAFGSMLTLLNKLANAPVLHTPVAVAATAPT